jgi:hypothetical protein
MKPSNYWLRVALGLLSVGGLIVVVLLMSRETPTRTEATLLNFLLFIFSVSASWIFSKIYSETTASENLRDYGVQVARGVMVLQSQIVNLNRWISTKRQELPTDLATGVTSAQFEHIEETLRGFQAQSDATLRGIASVIGGAFKQYEETLSQINQIRKEEAEEKGKIIREVSQLHVGYDRDSEMSVSDIEGYDAVVQKIADLEHRTNQRIEELAKTTSLPIDIQRPERRIDVRCPVCGNINQTSISSDPGYTRKISCYSCRSDFNVHIDSAGNSFVRLIATRAPVEKLMHSAQFDSAFVELPDVAYSVRSIKKRVSALDFVKLTKRLTKMIESPDSPQQTINEINKRLSVDSGDGLAVAGKKVSEYLQILFWGRFFIFLEQPGFNSSVANEQATYFEVTKAFFKGVGYNFAKTGLLVNEAREKEDIRRYGPELSPEEVAEVFRTFFDSHRNYATGEGSLGDHGTSGVSVLTEGDKSPT